MMHLLSLIGYPAATVVPSTEVSAGEIYGLLLVLALSLVFALTAYWHTRYSPQVKSVHSAGHMAEMHAEATQPAHAPAEAAHAEAIPAEPAAAAP